MAEADLLESLTQSITPNNVNQTDAKGCTELWKAAKNGHNSIIDFLITNGANIESIPIRREFRDIVEGLIEEEDDEFLEDFLEHGDEQEILQATPLYMAIENNHTETCKLLVDHGADYNFRYHGFSMLHISVIHGNLELVQFFIEKGINVNTEDDNEGYTPLYSTNFMKEI